MVMLSIIYISLNWSYIQQSVCDHTWAPEAIDQKTKHNLFSSLFIARSGQPNILWKYAKRKNVNK